MIKKKTSANCYEKDEDEEVKYWWADFRFFLFLFFEFCAKIPNVWDERETDMRNHKKMIDNNCWWKYKFTHPVRFNVMKRIQSSCVCIDRIGSMPIT